MTNKLLEILNEFDESFSMEFSYKTHDRLKKFLQEKLIEYARSKVPVKVENYKGNSTEIYINGRNSTIIEILDRIDQDLQSLKK